MASRRWPSAHEPRATSPSPSGPRWASAAVMAATSAVGAGPPGSTRPAKPHTLASPGDAAVERQHRLQVIVARGRRRRLVERGARDAGEVVDVAGAEGARTV